MWAFPLDVPPHPWPEVVDAGAGGGRGPMYFILNVFIRFSFFERSFLFDFHHRFKMMVMKLIIIVHVYY
jgi:hypothetical protein